MRARVEYGRGMRRGRCSDSRRANARGRGDRLRCRGDAGDTSRRRRRLGRRASMRVSAQMARYVPSEDMGEMRVRVRERVERAMMMTMGDAKRRLNWMARGTSRERARREGCGLTNV